MKKVCLLVVMFFIGINLVLAKEKVIFSKCVDGDTFKAIIDDEIETIRLLAVDTPEISKNGNKAQYYGDEASEYTCNKLKKAKKIELEYDNNSDKTDKYGRVLAWVYVDGKLLQEDLISFGYAKVAYLYGDYKYTSTLQEKQELASAKEIGIWNSADKDKYENNEMEKEDEAYNFVVWIVGIIVLGIVFIFDKIFNKKK